MPEATKSQSQSPAPLYQKCSGKRRVNRFKINHWKLFSLSNQEKNHAEGGKEPEEHWRLRRQDEKVWCLYLHTPRKNVMQKAYLKTYWLRAQHLGKKHKLTDSRSSVHSKWDKLKSSLRHIKTKLLKTEDEESILKRRGCVHACESTVCIDMRYTGYTEITRYPGVLIRNHRDEKEVEKYF